MADNEIPPAQTTFYYKAYYEPTTGLHYTVRDPATGLWHGQKIPAVLLDSPPSAGVGKGSRMAPMRKLRSKR